MTSTALSASTWYHVVVTYDGTVAKTYLNGVVDSSATTTLSGAANLTIGSYSQGNSSVFSGIIDDLRLYNRALSAQEVQNFTATSSPR